jgi:elongation factor 1-alpha
MAAAELKLDPSTSGEEGRKDLIVAMVGAVDNGKSTTVGVLTDEKQRLDDGNGGARSLVLVHPHEKERGQTSDLSQRHHTFGDKRVTFVDLAGHEKYLKTTIRGITTYKPDFGLICVSKGFGSSNGVDGYPSTAVEHAKLMYYMKVPMAFVITKIDQTPDQVLKDTLAECKRVAKKKLGKAKLFEIKTLQDLNQMYQKCIIPFVRISNKTGQGLDLLRALLAALRAKPRKLPPWFTIDHIYRVPGTGVVVSGFAGQSLKKNMTVFVGPYGSLAPDRQNDSLTHSRQNDGKNTQWRETKIRNIRDDFDVDVPEVIPGQRCCLWLKWKMVDAKLLRVGQVVALDPKPLPLTQKFEALVQIWHHHTSINRGYVCYVNCGAVKESVKFTRVDGVLRSGSMAKVEMEFQQNLNVIQPGDVFYFRESTTRGMGKVTRLL